MQQVADYFKVPINAVMYTMRRYNIQRRSISEAQAVRFENKKPSFTKKEITNFEMEKIEIMGVMLYWGEGYKNPDGGMVDFANSDPSMIVLFMKYLRSAYALDEGRLRGYMYCYSDQDVSELIRYWSNITSIPISQFTKSYVRNDYKKEGRKMKYGLLHVRYSDKKLLLDILEQIEKYRSENT